MSSSSQNFVAAFVIALALHAVLAVALALYLTHAPAPDELPCLDLTSVDLSFAETVEESAAAVPSAPSPVDAASSPRPPVNAASSPRQIVDATPPSRQTVPEPVLPSLAEPVGALPPPAVVKTEDARRETRDETERQTKDERRKTDDAARAPRPQAAPQAASAPRQARVDAPPRPRRSIRPDYPRESRLRGEHGDVTLELEVAADGSVSAVRVVKSPGYPLLEEAAVKAARAARFTPAQSGGKSVASTARLTLTFKLK